MRKLAAGIWVCLFLVTSFTEYAVAQTTIVAIRTPEEIWIGADSKVTAVNDKSIAKSACKIKQLGPLFYAFAGLSTYTKSNYDLDATVKEASQNGSHISDKVENFDKVIVARLSKVLKLIRRDRPAYFVAEVKGKVVIQIAFAGIENGVPKLFVRYIGVEGHEGDELSMTVNKMNCPGDCARGEIKAYLGHNKAISRFMEENNEFWEIGYAAGIRKLIQIQIEADPDDVGPPIDVLRISNRGGKWIQKKPECQEIKRW